MIPYVMDDTMTLPNIANNSTNGMGRLAECVSLFVTEALNGQYTAKMVIPTVAYNSGLIHKDGIIKAKANGTDDPQLFRIVSFKETLSSGLIECELEHISYDLNKSVVLPQTDNVAYTNLTNVCAVLNNTGSSGSLSPASVFTFYTDTGASDYNQTWYIPHTPRQLFFEKEGVCNIANVQMYWDNLEVHLNTRRGADKRDSVIVEYGKNVADFSQEADITEVYDGAVGYVYQENKWENAVISNIVPVTVGDTPQHIRIVNMSDYINMMNLDSPPSKAQVTTWTNTWLQDNNVTLPKVALNIDLVSLEDNGEYDKLKELETVELGDTITIKIGTNDIDATVTEVEYDSLIERYTKIKLGNYRPSLESTILNLTQQNLNDLSSTKTQYASVASQTSNGLMSASDKSILDGTISSVSLSIPRLNQTVTASCVMLNRRAALIYANTTASTSSNTGNLYIDLSGMTTPFAPTGLYGSAFIANKYAVIMRGSSNNNAWFSTLGGSAENVTGAQASAKPLVICMVIYNTA